jgi:hypothetical protein
LAFDTSLVDGLMEEYEPNDYVPMEDERRWGLEQKYRDAFEQFMLQDVQVATIQLVSGHLNNIAGYGTLWLGYWRGLEYHTDDTEGSGSGFPHHCGKGVWASC